MQPQAADLKRVDFIEDKIRREFAAMTVSLDDGVERFSNLLRRMALMTTRSSSFNRSRRRSHFYAAICLCAATKPPLRGSSSSLLMRWLTGIEAGQESDALLTSLDLALVSASLLTFPFPQLAPRWHLCSRS